MGGGLSFLSHVLLAPFAIGTRAFLLKYWQMMCCYELSSAVALRSTLCVRCAQLSCCLLFSSSKQDTLLVVMQSWIFCLILGTLRLIECRGPAASLCTSSSDEF